MAEQFVFECKYCGQKWDSRDLFLKDPYVKLVGYQVNFNILETGLFLFEHSVCKNTISFEVSAFTDLYKGPVFRKRQTGTESCPGYCLYKDNLIGCKEYCECAYVRSVMQILKHYRMIFV